MSDVLLFQTQDDGDIEVEGGTVTLSGGLETAAYLSLFGGNPSGGEYWGNGLDNAPARKLVSETQRLLRTAPLTTGNLARVNEAAKRDLQWMVDAGAASSVEVVASIPALDTVGLAVTISAQGEESKFEFAENWRQSR